MTLAVMHEIIGPARAAGRGVGAFNVIGIEHAEAIVAGAEAAGAPVVLQISENCVAYHGALEPIARACLAIARSAAVPAAVHLDHATSVELVHVAAGLGLGSVMYDVSALPYAENVRATADVARALATRPDLNSGPPPVLTIVTNALNIATELAVRQHIKIVTTGGVARPQSYELTGPLATGVLEQVTLDVAILGVDAIDAVAGATAHHEGEASINRLMARQASRVVIVADSSKAGRRAFARICTAREIDVLVTDKGIASDDAAQLEEAGVDIITA
jgi:DeoR C terminal sensor domain/Fructose-bisphosphate aldolase class-II